VHKEADMQGHTRSRCGRTSLISRYTFDLGQCISRQRGEQAWRAAAMEQALASRAKSEFLANMSHELRTPLNAIIGFSDLIAGGGQLPSGKAAEYARLINGAGKHLLAIISDILDVSKIESGTFELDLEMHPLRELIVGAAAMVEHRIAEKGQLLFINLPQDLPMVCADGRRLKQIVVNLLSNAHKFAPKGGRITVTASSAEGGFIAVCVRDNGIGMSPESVALALQPFGQVDARRTRQSEGTGLGLPIAKALVEQHGGAFRLESAEGKGTAITFTIPAGTLPPRTAQAGRTGFREISS
jgi:two-component system, cell cycle sensor histidine kinase PleC